MKLREIIPFKYRVTEADASKLRAGVIRRIEGVFQRADTKNANSRVYPLSLWSDVLRRPDVTERIQRRQMLGMLGHPADGQTVPREVSHVITKQELRNDGTIIGEAEILDTPDGRIAATFFDAGVELGISSRGDGSVEKKGDEDIVQNDFRLETYDLVLKPSTPGAYPQVVEHIEENEKLIAEAIEGLVKSELKEDQRLPILLSSLKILSVLEAKNCGDLVKSLTKSITEEVQSSTDGKILISVIANEEIDTPVTVVEDKPEPITENRIMATPQVDASILAWHQSQMNEAVGKVSAQARQAVSHLKTELIKQQKESLDAKRRLTAAEGIIEGFQNEIKKLKENTTRLQHQAGKRPDKVMERRYRAAVDLLDESLKQLPRIGVLSRRAKALESLLQVSIDNAKGGKLSEAVKRHMSKLPQDNTALLEHAKKAAGSCRTPEQVAETFRALMYAAGIKTPASGRRADPLPGGKVRPVNESRQPANPSLPGASFQARVAARLSRAV